MLGRCLEIAAGTGVNLGLWPATAETLVLCTAPEPPAVLSEVRRVL